jgi:SAM-dependent methyltransferase
MPEIDDLRHAFEDIYRRDAWSDGSGPGSQTVNTIEYRAFLERFIEANRIRAVTDLGCGDWRFSRHMDWTGLSYTGFDVVEEVVESNIARYARQHIDFRPFRSIGDLPGGDLLLAKEVLQHLPNQTVLDYLPVIRSRYKFALLTNSTEPREMANIDIGFGGYRPLRLDEPPFEAPGAKVLTYYPQNQGYIWKNVVFLMMGLGVAGSS